MAEVVTGEAIALDLAVAPTLIRIAALLIDLTVQVTTLIVSYQVIFPVTGRFLNDAWTAAIAVVVFVLVVIGYPTLFETLSRGKSLGKLALGIRIVSDDAGPVRFRQSLIRALAGAFIEIWLVPLTPIVVIGLPAGLITSFVTDRHKRLGDVFAGTFAIAERMPRRPDLPMEFSVVPDQLAAWARHLEVASLSDPAVVAAGHYLRRYRALRPDARWAIGSQIAAAIAAQVSPPPPPGTPPEAYLAAVLATQRERDRTLSLLRRAAETSNQAADSAANQTAHPAANQTAPDSMPTPSTGPGTDTDGFAVPF